MLEFATGKLWDKAEELESILEDNNIDHESLSTPINYHDIEDLRAHPINSGERKYYA